MKNIVNTDNIRLICNVKLLLLKFTKRTTDVCSFTFITSFKTKLIIITQKLPSITSKDVERTFTLTSVSVAWNCYAHANSYRVVGMQSWLLKGQSCRVASKSKILSTKKNKKIKKIYIVNLKKLLDEVFAWYTLCATVGDLLFFHQKVQKISYIETMEYFLIIINCYFVRN